MTKIPKSGVIWHNYGPYHLARLAAFQAHVAAQGKPVDTGGYYLPDQAKTSAGMRPSATLNTALASL